MLRLSGEHLVDVEAGEDQSRRGEIKTHDQMCQVVGRECAAGVVRPSAGVTGGGRGNTGDRPIQIGSHYHFAEANPALDFDRAKAKGYRLDVAAGTAIRFEPGQTRAVTLIPFVGKREIYGFRGDVMGPLDRPLKN